MTSKDTSSINLCISASSHVIVVSNPAFSRACCSVMSASESLSQTRTLNVRFVKMRTPLDKIFKLVVGELCAAGHHTVGCKGRLLLFLTGFQVIEKTTFIVHSYQADKPESENRSPIFTTGHLNQVRPLVGTSYKKRPLRSKLAIFPSPNTSPD